MRLSVFVVLISASTYTAVGQSVLKKSQDSLDLKSPFHWYSKTNKDGTFSLDDSIKILELINLPKISITSSSPKMPIYEPTMKDSRMKVFVPDSLPKQYIRIYKAKE